MGNSLEIPLGNFPRKSVGQISPENPLGKLFILFIYFIYFIKLFLLFLLFFIIFEFNNKTKLKWKTESQ